MKKTLLFLLNLVFVATFAQAPQSIKYQAIARNGAGSILLNQNLSMRISILSDSIVGIAMYAETHAVTSNAFGLVNLEIGRGNPVFGSFAAINWSKGNFFIKIEADENAGNNFSFLGVSQLSVPYALYANSAGVPRLTDAQRDGLVNPTEGMIVYNLTTQCLNYRRSNSWYQVCGDCVPQPSLAYAGADALVCLDTIYQLSATAPVNGTGTWSIVSGGQGAFSDLHNPTAFFTGINQHSYVLNWQVATSCNSLDDQVSITFNYMYPANAGEDQYLPGTTLETNLAANDPGQGNYGFWSIVSGGTGVFSGPTNPGSHFTGTSNNDYVLRWTIMSSCDTSYDEVLIAHCPPPAVVMAGMDTTLVFATNLVLQGNAPGINESGSWSIVNGNGGSFANPALHNTAFYGLLNNAYTLRWTITNVCSANHDDVVVNFSTTASNLYLLGDATNVDWDSTNAIPMNSYVANHFVKYIRLSGAPDGIKFILTPGSWAINWGTSETNPVNLGQEYDLVWYGNNIRVADTGNYLVEVNLQTNKFKVSAFYTPDNLYLVGGSTPAGWFPAQALPFQQQSLGVFHIYAPLLSTGFGYKFLPNMGSYDGDWGQNPAEPGRIIQEGEENCPAPDSGFYLIIVDYTNWTFSATKTDWGIIGGATPGGWGGGTNMTYIGGAEPYSWQINNVSLQDGVFKFLANNSWAINLGDNGLNSSLELYGDLIPVTAGIYNIKLNLEPGNWTYVISNITAPNPCSGVESFTYGGQLYHTVAIGTQCWMQENLNIGTMIYQLNDQINNGILEKYCFLNDTASCSVYGGFYQWDEMMQYVTTVGAQGICPEGFHLPSKPEWTQLFDGLGGVDVGGKMKEANMFHWNFPNTGATNESGFTAIGAGVRNSSGAFAYLHAYADFWTSSAYDANGAWGQEITANSSQLFSGSYTRNWGFSVRCVKN